MHNHKSRIKKEFAEIKLCIKLYTINAFWDKFRGIKLLRGMGFHSKKKGTKQGIR